MSASNVPETDRFVPLLRAPPFPGVAAAVAAISRSSGDGSAADPARLADVVTLILEARVGGTFWADPVPLQPCAIARPTSLTSLEAMAGAAGSDALFIFPDQRWARRAAGRVPRALIGTFDPWSVLRPGVRLLCNADDEWALIGMIAGAKVDPTPGDGRLRQALLDVAYRDCFGDTPASIARAVEILAGWRTTLDANRSIAAAVGMAWWKRDAMRRFLWSGGAGPTLLTDNTAQALRQATSQGGGIAVWPSRSPVGLGERAASAGVPLIQVEDGFIRSIGLGSNLHPPQSVVVDGRGIYYDPTRPSDLEVILATAPFPPDLIERGEALARTIVAQGISKYARVAPPATAARDRGGRRIVLVAGQVEDDMSVRLGGREVQGNLDLLRRARGFESDRAHILFKPHPDVDAGHRTGHVADDRLLEFADEIVRGEAMPTLLARVDAVHVLTSLTGFEALLRGCEVIVHGQPFFAGWGLTRDLAQTLPRRRRRLTLGELVAGTLILYPRYLDPVTGLPCPPETVLDRFATGWRPKPSLIVRARQMQGRLARLLG